MNMVINPGSHIGGPGQGWTNTYDRALDTAREWLTRMHSDGLTDVVLRDPSPQHHREGRWSFYFQHTVTGVIVELETHGIHPLDAYEAERIFTPRIYWNGCSTSNPELEHFAAEGFEPVCTYRPVPRILSWSTSPLRVSNPCAPTGR